MVDDDRIVGCNELGLSEDAFAQLGVEEGHPTFINQAEPATSIPALHRKIAGERLTQNDFQAIVRDIAEHRYSKIELTAFVVASNQGQLDREEVYYLTEAMAAVGRRLDWREHPVVDKHCIGGIPATAPPCWWCPSWRLTACCAPKLRLAPSPRPQAQPTPWKCWPKSSRHSSACGKSCASTGVSGLGRHQRIVASGRCADRGGAPLSIDSPGQMVASILSKKIAAGSSHLLLDIPVGPPPRCTTCLRPSACASFFEFVAGRLGLTLDVVITDGRQPVGNGIGPVLEARDVMRVLRNDPRAPTDLRQKALRLAGRMLEFDPMYAEATATPLPETFSSQGEPWPRCKPSSKRKAPNHSIPTPRSGPAELRHRGRPDRRGHRHRQPATGAGGLPGWRPKVQGAGVDLLRKLGDLVAAGEPLYRVYAAYPADLEFARQSALKQSGFRLGHADEVPHLFVEF